MVAYRSIAVTLGQAGHIKELFHVIDTMRSPPKKKFKPTTLAKWDPRLEPDVVVYNAVSDLLLSRSFEDVYSLHLMLVVDIHPLQVLNACFQRKQW